MRGGKENRLFIQPNLQINCNNWKLKSGNNTTEHACYKKFRDLHYHNTDTCGGHWHQMAFEPIFASPHTTSFIDWPISRLHVIENLLVKI